MDYPIDVFASGAVRLGPDVSCDGFHREAKARVQTHIHADHMNGFMSSKGFQSIILSEPSRELLIAEYNAELPYRSNIIALPERTSYTVNNSKVSLMSSGHMLGAVQVLVELEQCRRVGYSGDFQWPIDDVIQVDALVVDCTYGSPTNVRRFSQGECEARFVQLIERSLARGPVYINAHRGTLQRALQLISAEVNCPIVGSARLCKEVEVYRQFGYAIGEIASFESDEANQLQGEQRVIRVYGLGDHFPSDIGNGTKVVLSAYFTRPDEPIVEYSDRAFGVAMSNHADFNGTLEYVKSTGARFVVTDNSRHGKAYELASEIKRRLGIKARPSRNLGAGAWGK